MSTTFLMEKTDYFLELVEKHSFGVWNLKALAEAGNSRVCFEVG